MCIGIDNKEQQWLLWNENIVRLCFVVPLLKVHRTYGSRLNVLLLNYLETILVNNVQKNGTKKDSNMISVTLSGHLKQFKHKKM